MFKRTAILLTAIALMSPLTGTRAQSTAGSPDFTPEQLYEQVALLQVASTLQLTSEQITQLTPLLEGIGENRGALLSSADEAWNQYGEAIQQVISAQIGGQQASAEVRQSANVGVTSFRNQRDVFYRSLESSVALLQSYLTVQQRQLIAPPGPAESQAQRAVALEGASSLSEYIVGVINTQRNLMPDEYALIRIPEAQRVAAKIVPPNAPQFGQIVEQVLQLADTVHGQSPAQYIQQYPALVEQVAQYLQLPAPSAQPPISYQQLLDFLTSPYTLPLLQQAAALATIEPLPTDLRLIEDCLVSEAGEVSDLVGLLDYLQISVPQLSAIAPAVQRIAAILQPIREPAANQDQSFKNILIQVRDLLLAGGQVPPEWQQFQTNLEQQRDQARQQIAQQLERVQRRLLPGQNQLIDWQPPMDILAADSRRLAREQMRVLAEMRTVVDVFERLRFRQMQDYQRTRIAELNQLLERYGIPEDSPAYEEFRSFGIEILNQMRQTPWEQWQQARIALAVEFLGRLGVIGGASAGPAQQAPLTWQDMFTALTSPQAPLLIQQMITARASGQLPQEPIPLDKESLPSQEE